MYILSIYHVWVKYASVKQDLYKWVRKPGPVRLKFEYGFGMSLTNYKTSKGEKQTLRPLTLFRFEKHCYIYLLNGQPIAGICKNSKLADGL